MRLDNIRCVYCGKHLAKGEETKEHLIGRRFVPKGKLNRQWNLLLNACSACSACNGRKADLENDISAITLQRHPMGEREPVDQSLAAEAARKAERSFSRRTGRPVKDSAEHFVIKVPFGPAQLTFNMTAPPQVSSDRVFQLARMHIEGLFHWLT